MKLWPIAMTPQIKLSAMECVDAANDFLLTLIRANVWRTTMDSVLAYLLVIALIKHLISVFVWIIVLARPGILGILARFSARRLTITRSHAPISMIVKIK